MSKFNQKKVDSDLTLNEEGALAYRKQDREALVSMVLTTFYNEEKFYGDNSDELVERAKTMIVKDAKFVANLAIYARNEMNLRSVSHVLCATLAYVNEGKEWVRYACDNCILRADDITEILAYYVNTYGKPIPNSLKKALASAMEKFDEYQLAKYTKKGSQFNFKDVLRLTHAKAKTEERNELYKKVVSDTLATPYTWETELSSKGNTKEVWEELIASGKVGYMALLRNLNNIVKAEPSNIDDALNVIKNEKAVLKSKVLPFRFFSAYTKLAENENTSSKVLDAIEEAIEVSVKNMEKLSGKTLIAVDVSGSMRSPVSRRSETTCCDIARVLAAVSTYICEDSICLAFDDTLNKVSLSSKSGIIANAKSIEFRGGGTYCDLPIDYITQNKIVVDRIIMLSDNMCNSDSFARACYGRRTTTQTAVDNYKNKVNKDVIIHAVDLQGYSTKQVKGEGVNFIAGWNENILSYINLYEKGVTSLIEAVENYEVKKGN